MVWKDKAVDYNVNSPQFNGILNQFLVFELQLSLIKYRQLPFLDTSPIPSELTSIMDDPLHLSQNW